MSNDFTVGRINFGPRNSVTTLWEIMDKFIAQEEWAARQVELNEDLLLLLGEMATEIEWLRSHLPDQIYEL